VLTVEGEAEQIFQGEGANDRADSVDESHQIAAGQDQWHHPPKRHVVTSAQEGMTIAAELSTQFGPQCGIAMSAACWRRLATPRAV
jgi:hypothetical protein